MGFRPTRPQNEAGCLIDPPVSDPVAAKHKPLATADADPPDEPPGTSLLLSSDFGVSGFKTLPKKLVVLAEPIANSSIFVFPNITAPESQRFFDTVDS